ncbi:MAG: peptidoglycan-binding protein [Erysipelotrichaceae bacterium]|nr:peptidoglycan-binding protein [Erysipelotrichaceae bacterium]
MLILIYNEDTNKIEKYNRNLSEPMPYVNNSYLTVKEFKGSSKSTILWSSKKTMLAFKTTRQRFGSGIYIGYAFKRIFEGGHSGQSQHYAGTSFDCGQRWTYTKRKELYNLARKINVWSYVEPISQTPSWVHFDKRNTKPACSSGYPIVKYQSINTYVLILQDALNNLGYVLTIDGIFGNNTRNAVKQFQSKYKLSVDGIVGCNTWKKITSIVNGMGKSKYTKYY